MIITREQQEKLVSDYHNEKDRTVSEHFAFIDGMGSMFRMVDTMLIKELKERKQLNK